MAEYLSFDDYVTEQQNFPSQFAIGDSVSFIPMARHQEEYAIESSPGLGVITAVRFTKAKVFYDIVDEYWGFHFDNVDSVNVKSTNESIDESFSEGDSVDELRRKIRRKKKRRVKRSERQQIQRKKGKVKGIGSKSKNQLETMKLQIRKLKLKKKNAKQDSQKQTIQKQIDRLENKKTKLDIMVKKDLVAKNDKQLKNNSSDTRLQRHFKKKNKEKLRDLKKKKNSK